MKSPVWNKTTLLLLALFISALFLTMIRQFLMAIFLAGIFSAMFQPLYSKFVQWFKGRRSLASGITLLTICLIIILPLFLLLGIVTGQAIKVSNMVGPWVSQRVDGSTTFAELFRFLPFYDYIQQYNQEILTRAGELVGSISSFLLDSLSEVTFKTINFVFLFFVFLYTMFFFLKDGRLVLEKILYYLPLTTEGEQRLLERFSSVTRATIKGTLIIGVIQGSLAGAGFWAVGIDGAVFWGAVMSFLSIIPAIGSALVWIPAVIILAALGSYIKALLLLLYCGLLVGSVDNLLRPVMVGRDTKMHELFIFFGTLGGISLFGIIGFIVGPIVAALFVTIWEIYGETFKEYLA
ncbi:MAG: AI-2E family transporter [Desulfovibrionales bacterium]